MLQALTLDREAFRALLGRLDSLRSMWRFEALQRVPLFAQLDNKTKVAVAGALGQVNMPKGTAVVTQVRPAWLMHLRRCALRFARCLLCMWLQCSNDNARPSHRANAAMHFTLWRAASCRRSRTPARCR